MSSITFLKNGGWVADLIGNSVSFMFWQHNLDRRYWTVLGFEEFTTNGLAVVDDFGSLTEVRS
jgi:hypothetical protein